jgi:hypothetical protein
MAALKSQNPAATDKDFFQKELEESESLGLEIDSAVLHEYDTRMTALKHQYPSATDKELHIILLRNAVEDGESNSEYVELDVDPAAEEEYEARMEALRTKYPNLSEQELLQKGIDENPILQELDLLSSEELLNRYYANIDTYETQEDMNKLTFLLEALEKRNETERVLDVDHYNQLLMAILHHYEGAALEYVQMYMIKMNRAAGLVDDPKLVPDLDTFNMLFHAIIMRGEAGAAAQIQHMVLELEEHERFKSDYWLECWADLYGTAMASWVGAVLADEEEALDKAEAFYSSLWPKTTIMINAMLKVYAVKGGCADQAKEVAVQMMKLVRDGYDMCAPDDYTREILIEAFENGGIEDPQGEADAILAPGDEVQFDLNSLKEKLLNDPPAELDADEREEYREEVQRLSDQSVRDLINKDMFENFGISDDDQRKVIQWLSTADLDSVDNVSDEELAELGVSQDSRAEFIQSVKDLTKLGFNMKEELAKMPKYDNDETTQTTGKDSIIQKFDTHEIRQYLQQAIAEVPLPKSKISASAKKQAIAKCLANHDEEGLSKILALDMRDEPINETYLNQLMDAFERKVMEGKKTAASRPGLFDEESDEDDEIMEVNVDTEGAVDEEVERIVYDEEEDDDDDDMDDDEEQEIDYVEDPELVAAIDAAIAERVRKESNGDGETTTQGSHDDSISDVREEKDDKT